MTTAAEVCSGLDRQARTRARLFHCIYGVVAGLAILEAACLYLRLRVRAPAGIRWLRTYAHRPWKIVRAIAAVRQLRRLQRMARGAPTPAVIWPTAIPSSCVLGFFHSMWDLVIARELVSRQYCLLRAPPVWPEDLGKQHVAWDRAGLKSLLRRVAAGARCAAAMDNFVREGGVGFFRTRSSLNPAGVRLAAATGRPLVPVWPAYERGVLSFEVGAPIAASTCAERPEQALRLARQFFESAVRRNPAAWRRIVSFLERELRNW